MDTIVIILALCGGALLSVRGGDKWPSWQPGWECCAAPFLTFATGALVTGLLILFFCSSDVGKPATGA